MDTSSLDSTSPELPSHGSDGNHSELLSSIGAKSDKLKEKVCNSSGGSEVYDIPPQDAAILLLTFKYANLSKSNSPNRFISNPVYVCSTVPYSPVFRSGNLSDCHKTSFQYKPTFSSDVCYFS